MRIYYYESQEIERLQHPQLKMIPERIWSQEYHYGVDERIIDLISRPEEEIFYQVKRFYFDLSNKKLLFLTLAFCQPHTLRGRLSVWQDELNLDVRDMLELLICVGKESLIKEFIDSHQVNGNFALALQKKLSTLLPKAADSCSFDVFLYLKAQCERTMLNDAVQNNNVDLLNYILSSKSPEDFPQLYIEAYLKAAFYGRMALIIDLEKRAPSLLTRMITEQDNFAYRWAVENNHHQVAEHLRQYPAVQEYIKMREEEPSSTRTKRIGFFEETSKTTNDNDDNEYDSTLSYG